MSKLLPLPSQQRIIDAAARLRDDRLDRGWEPARAGTFTASDLAFECNVQPARRHGRGAVKGSWSGYMAPALRLAPRLRAMERQGLLARGYVERDRHVEAYRLP